MPKPAAIVWTAEMDALLGTMPDKAVADQFGLDEERARYRRIRLKISAYRLSRGPVMVPCANCGTETERKHRDLRRSTRLFCSKMCADAGQKTRDSDLLRYGPGWKNTRARVRQRDKTCRVCAKTPEQNGQALHVHHLVPYRFGGTNQMSNLIALCDSCHHVVEAVMTSTLSAIPLEVSLENSILTITLDGVQRWRRSVRGADSLTLTG
jgi:5-methylcytosine-specific restriction endonuclease McrA